MKVRGRLKSTAHRVLACGLLLAPMVVGGPTAAEVRTLVAGSPLHGIQGLTFGPDGMLYAGAISAQEITQIDPRTGVARLIVPAPHGEADDLAIGPDGTIAWSAIVAGELRIRTPDGRVHTLATDLPGINPVAFHKDGRLFAGQLGPKNALYEFDVSGTRPPRTITTAIDQLNSFEFGTDGRLYGPFWQTGTLVAIDTQTGTVSRLATGLNTPSAVSLDSRGRLVSVDYNSGDVQRTDPSSGITASIAKLEPPLDNLAVGPDDTIYISDTANSGIIAVHPETGMERRVVGGAFSTPGGLAMTVIDNRESLIVADSTGYRFVDPQTGRVERPRFDMRFGGSLDIAANDLLIAATDARLGRVQLIDRKRRELLADVRNLKQPYGVVILPDGDLLVAEHGSGSLQRISASGALAPAATHLHGPIGVAALDAHFVLVSENTSGRLTRIDLRDGRMRAIAKGLKGPEGIALLGTSHVVVAEVGASRVVAVSLSTGRTQVLAKGLPLERTAILTPESVGMPTGVAVGRDGAIFVSCGGDGTIRRISGYQLRN